MSPTDKQIRQGEVAKRLEDLIAAAERGNAGLVAISVGTAKFLLGELHERGL